MIWGQMVCILCFAGNSLAQFSHTDFEFPLRASNRDAG